MTDRISHILVVDDHLDSLDFMASFLARGSRTISIATGFEQAMQVAAAQKPDLLVTDVHFPDGDGCLLLSELRRKVNPAMQGVAITGGGGEATQKRCEEAGFSAFLLKPVDLMSIKAAVEAALSRTRP